MCVFMCVFITGTIKKTNQYLKVSKGRNIGGCWRKVNKREMIIISKNKKENLIFCSSDFYLLLYLTTS